MKLRTIMHSPGNCEMMLQTMVRSSQMLGDAPGLLSGGGAQARRA